LLGKSLQYCSNQSEVLPLKKHGDGTQSNMKHIPITILLLGISAICLGQTKDEAAIRKILESEIINFHKNTNRKVYVSYWQIKRETLFVSSSLDGSNIFLTSDDFKAGIANNQYPPADNASVSFSNFVVKAGGTTGWASYDIKMVTPEGKEDHIHSFRGLEKVRGVWKIITGSEHQYKPR
jgi:hypothetical protein